MNRHVVVFLHPPPGRLLRPPASSCVLLRPPPASSPASSPAHVGSPASKRKTLHDGVTHAQLCMFAICQSHSTTSAFGWPSPRCRISKVIPPVLFVLSRPLVLILHRSTDPAAVSGSLRPRNRQQSMVWHASLLTRRYVVCASALSHDIAAILTSSRSCGCPGAPRRLPHHSTDAACPLAAGASSFGGGVIPVLR